MNLGFTKYKSDSVGGVLIHAALAIGIILVLGILYFYAYLPNSTNHGESITVPRVEGESVEQAEKILTARDLRMEVSDSSYSSEFPPLAVLKQVPAADSRVKEQRKIYVTINRVNPPSVPLPPILETSLVNAEAYLKSYELKRGKISYVPGPFTNVVKEMKVEGRTIVPGVKIPKGTVIDLVVMDGGKAPEMPEVLGMELGDALVLIRGNYLTPGMLHINAGVDTTGGQGIVIRQLPAPGQTMLVGDVVELWIGAKLGDTPDNEPTQGNEPEN